MKRAFAFRGSLWRCGESDGAVIGNRDPGADRNRDDQATRSYAHIDLIAEAARVLKCFLFDPRRTGAGLKKYFRATRYPVKEMSGSIPRPARLA